MQVSYERRFYEAEHYDKWLLAFMGKAFLDCFVKNNSTNRDVCKDFNHVGKYIISTLQNIKYEIPSNLLDTLVIQYNILDASGKLEKSHHLFKEKLKKQCIEVQEADAMWSFTRKLISICGGFDSKSSMYHPFYSKLKNLKDSEIFNFFIDTLNRLNANHKKLIFIENASKEIQEKIMELISKLNLNSIENKYSADFSKFIANYSICQSNEEYQENNLSFINFLIDNFLKDFLKNNQNLNLRKKLVQVNEEMSTNFFNDDLDLKKLAKENLNDYEKNLADSKLWLNLLKLLKVSLSSEEKLLSIDEMINQLSAIQLTVEKGHLFDKDLSEVVKKSITVKTLSKNNKFYENLKKHFESDINNINTHKEKIDLLKDKYSEELNNIEKIVEYKQQNAIIDKIDKTDSDFLKEYINYDKIYEELSTILQLTNEELDSFMKKIDQVREKFISLSNTQKMNNNTIGEFKEIIEKYISYIKEVRFDIESNKNSIASLLDGYIYSIQSTILSKQYISKNTITSFVNSDNHLNNNIHGMFHTPPNNKRKKIDNEEKTNDPVIKRIKFSDS